MTKPILSRMELYVVKGIQYKLRGTFFDRRIAASTALFPLALGLGTILVCYGLASSYGHLENWQWAPQISELGIQPPERYMYQIGFSLTGFCMVIVGMTVSTVFLPVLVQAQAPYEVKNLTHTHAYAHHAMLPTTKKCESLFLKVF